MALKETHKVEDAGTGDSTIRVSRMDGSRSWTVRFDVPEGRLKVGKQTIRVEPGNVEIHGFRNGGTTTNGFDLDSLLRGLIGLRGEYAEPGDVGILAGTMLGMIQRFDKHSEDSDRELLVELVEGCPEEECGGVQAELIEELEHHTIARSADPEVRTMIGRHDGTQAWNLNIHDDGVSTVLMAAYPMPEEGDMPLCIVFEHHGFDAQNVFEAVKAFFKDEKHPTLEPTEHEAALIVREARLMIRTLAMLKTKQSMGGATIH